MPIPPPSFYRYSIPPDVQIRKVYLTESFTSFDLEIREAPASSLSFSTTDGADFTTVS